MSKQDFCPTIISLILVLLLISGCSPSDIKEGMHPDPSRFPPANKVNYSVDVTKYNESPLPHFFDPDSLYPVATIAKDSALGNEFYKRPPTIDIDPRGNIYMVQLHTNSIRVYDKKGNFIYSIGKGGKGPGEFLAVGSFAFNKDYTKLYVLDVFEIEIFTFAEGRFKYQTTVPHKLMRAYDICFLGNNLYISGYKMTRKARQAYEDEKVRYRVQGNVTPPINKFSLKSHKITNSFGFLYHSYNDFGTYNGLLSQTMLSCNGQTNTVVGYLKRYPFIFGYDTTAHRTWFSKIKGYKSTKSREEKSTKYDMPALIPYANKGIFNWKYPVQKINHKQYALLQFGYAPLVDYFKTPKGADNPSRVRTVLINTRTGKSVYSDAYKYIGAWKNNTVITMDINPENLIKTFTINEIR